MAKRGRSRKSALRQPNGRIRHPSIDRGHEVVLDRRASLIAGADPRDARAGYPLGILALRQQLGATPEENDGRHRAGLIYAALHAIACGRGNATRSHLANIVVGELSVPSQGKTEEWQSSCRSQFERAVAAVREVSRRAFSVLENIVIYEHPMRFMDTARRRTPAAWQADARDLAALRAALETLAVEFRIAR